MYVVYVIQVLKFLLLAYQLEDDIERADTQQNDIELVNETANDGDTEGDLDDEEDDETYGELKDSLVDETINENTMLQGIYLILCTGYFA